MRLKKRYTCRYILANGDPRAFVAYADNRSDAAADVDRQAREALGADFATARCEGVEVPARRVLMVGVDAGGRPRRILRQLTRGGRILD